MDDATAARSVAAPTIIGTMAGMSARLHFAPTWVHMVFAGAVYYLVTTGYRLATADTEPVVTLLLGLPGGVFFGIALGLVGARARRRADDAAAYPDGADRGAVLRAALDGRVPTDQGERQAAARLLRHLLARGGGRQIYAFVALLLVMTVVAAFLSPAALLVVLVVGALGAYEQVRRRRWQRHLAVLEGAPVAT